MTHRDEPKPEREPERRDSGDAHLKGAQPDWFDEEHEARLADENDETAEDPT